MMDELDRILSTERSISPSPGFSAAVMRAIAREATAPPAIPFPWSRMTPILAAAALLLLAAPFLPAWPAAGAASFTGSPAMRQLISALAALPLGYLAAALIGSLVAVRLSLRMASG
jgi:hypothetical protein